MGDVVEIKRIVNHALCYDCPHNEQCKSVCIAIEALVQLSKVSSPNRQLEYIRNISTYLDVENSFNSNE